MAPPNQQDPAGPLQSLENPAVLSKLRGNPASAPVPVAKKAAPAGLSGSLPNIGIFEGWHEGREKKKQEKYARATPEEQRLLEQMGRTGGDPVTKQVDPSLVSSMPPVLPESKEAQVLAKKTGMDGGRAAAAINAARGGKPDQKPPGTLSDLERLKKRLAGAENYNPLAGKESQFYESKMDKLRSGTNESLRLHKGIKDNLAIVQKGIEQKSIYDVENLEAEQEYAEAAKGEEHARSVAVEKLQQQYIKRTMIVDNAIDEELKMISEGQEMTGWDIFKKSALAIGAIAAAGGTIAGQMAMGKKYGGMPNVLMPLIMKAIDSDIASMKEEQKGTRLKGLLDLKGLVQGNFDDAVLQRGKLKEVGLKYSGAKLEAFKKRLPASKQEMITQIQAQLKMEHQKVQLENQNNANSIAESGAKGVIGLISEKDKLKSSMANRAYMGINGLSALIKHKKANQGTFDDLSTSQEKSLDATIKSLTMVPKIKNDMKVLVDKMGVDTLDQAIELTFDDAFSRFREGELTIQMADLQRDLNVFSQTYAKMYEDRLSNEDRLFWQDVAGGNLEKYSVLRAMASITSLEHWLRMDAFGTIAGLDPEYRKTAWDTKLLPALLPRSGDIGTAIADYAASVQSVIQQIRSGEGYSPFNVGIMEVEFTGGSGMALSRFVNDKYVSEITSDTARDYNESSLQQQVNGSINDDTRSFSSPGMEGFLMVDTASKTQKAPMSPRTHGHYSVLRHSAKQAGINLDQLMPIGGRSVSRTEGDVNALQAEGRPAVHKGYHTEHKGFRAIDFNFKEGSDAYAFMNSVGHNLGWRQEYDSPNHWIAPE